MSTQKRFDPNVISIGGRLARKPEIRYTPNEKAVTNVTIANSTGGESPNWIPVTIWGAQAESLCTHLDKGSYIQVEGVLQTRTYDNTEGKKITVVEVVARAVHWMDSVGPKNADNSNGQSYQQNPAQQQNYGQQQNPAQQQNYGQQNNPAQQQNYGQQNSQNTYPDAPNGGITIDINDDDLPF